MNLSFEFPLVRIPEGSKKAPEDGCAETSVMQWQFHDRGSYSIDNDILTIQGGWASAVGLDVTDFLLEFSARAPEDAPQVQIWAGFRHYSRDYRYVAALRGGANNHLYLARLGAEGYDKMLALRPLEWMPQPGKWHHFRILCAGTILVVYVDDFQAPLLCVKDEDAPFHGGSISLGGSYLPAQFKDVSLTALGAEEATFLMENPPAKAPDYLDGFTKSPAEKETQRQRERAAYRPFTIPALSQERQTLSLDGKWLFLPEQEAGENPQDPHYDDCFAHVIPVPSCWIPLQAWLEGENMRDMNKGMNDDYLVEERIRCLNQTFDYQETESAWYRHYIDLPLEIENKKVILDFEGIALISTIYWNGVKILENIGMFMPMEIDVSDHVRPGRNCLAILVRRKLTKEDKQSVRTATVDDHYAAAWNILNTGEASREQIAVKRREFNTDDIAHGFYANHPGGIWRSVRLIICDKCRMTDCFFQPTLEDASIEAHYVNDGASLQELTLSYSLVHKTMGEFLCGGTVESLGLEAGQEQCVRFTTPKVSPRLWSPGAPNLYLLTLSLSSQGRILDTLTQTVGFRTVAFEGQTLLYNGKPLWVRGGNHMPAHVKPNDRLLAQRFMALALEHNLMATRTHVAPWTSVWLDAADEAGLMVSLEGTWSWLMLEHIPSEQSIQLWKRELAALIRRHRNRPSLFLMTMNNEMKFYLHGDPDEVIAEKGRILEGGIRIARALLPHLPLVCDSAYYRKHALRSGRYENIICANGYDDGDIDDPHGYFGWYNPCFFHFMNGEFGRDYTVPGRPCMSQECATGYPRAEDGLPTRAYLFLHQTPQTTVGKKAYEYNDPGFFLGRHGMLTKELAEVLRRVEHDRTCGVLLFAFETWFYHQHDFRRIQPMLSARMLKMAYQPVLASIELWGRHFYAGSTLDTAITLINDSNERETPENLSVEVSVITREGEVLASTVLFFADLPYFKTAVRPLHLPLPETLPQDCPKGRLDVRLTSRVFSRETMISENEYEILLTSEDWGMGNPEEGAFLYLEDDSVSKELLAHYGCSRKALAESSALCGFDPAGTRPVRSDNGGTTLPRLLIGRPLTQEEAAFVRSFASAGGTALLLGQRELPDSLLGMGPVPFTERRQEIVTMNLPESGLFDGIEELDISWFSDGRQAPYVACGRYSVNRFRRDLCVLAETLEWHGYIDKPTDYKKYGGTPLFWAKCGQGRILVSALRTDAVFSDPVASRLTGNLLGWDFDEK